MTIQDNVHFQRVSPIHSEYSFQNIEFIRRQNGDFIDSGEEEKGWVEWLATPIIKIWQWTKVFFSWVLSWFPWWKKKEESPDDILLPIGNAINSLRKLTIDANKENVSSIEIEKKYKREYAKLPSFVRSGLEQIAAEMLYQGHLRKKAPKNPKPIYKSHEEILNRAKHILQKPENKIFHLYPIFEDYLRRIQHEPI